MPTATITDLLEHYRSLLGSCADHRRKLPFPWCAGPGTTYFLTEHVRTMLDVLRRRYELQTALLGDSADDLAEDTQRVEAFAAALPQRPSRWFAVALVAVGIVLVQFLLSALSSGLLFVGVKHGTSLGDQLEQIGGSFQVTAPARAVAAISHTELYGVCFLGICVFSVAFLILGPLSLGLNASRVIRDPKRIERNRKLDSIVRRRVVTPGRPTTDDLEQEIFSNLDMAPPRGSNLDLVAKVLPCAVALLLAFALFALYQHGTDVYGGPYDVGAGVQGGHIDYYTVFDKIPGLLIVVVILGVGALARGVNLACLYTRRQQRLTSALSPFEWTRAPTTAKLPRTLVVATGVAVVMCFIVYAIADREPPSVTASYLAAGRSSLTTNGLVIHAACNEPCSLRAAKLGFERFPTGVGGTGHQLDADIRFRASGDGSVRSYTVSLRFTPEQVAWLRQEVKARSSVAVELDLTDRSNNESEVTLGLS